MIMREEYMKVCLWRQIQKKWPQAEDYGSENEIECMREKDLRSTGRMIEEGDTSKC